MRRLHKGLLLCALVTATLTVTGCQKAARDYGTTMTINLKPGEKLEEITWKDDSDLWYLTRPMRDEEKAETHRFRQSKDFSIIEGEVVIIEREK